MMATRRMSWQAAVETACDEMVRFATCRANGFAVEQAAAAVGIGLTTAIRYQRTIDRLMADLKTDAASGRPGPKAAETAPTE